MSGLLFQAPFPRFLGEGFPPQSQRGGFLTSLPPLPRPEPSSTLPSVVGPPSRPKVFIVHGRDRTLRTEVEMFLQKGGAEAVILEERSMPGQTLIDELIRQSENVKFAVVLATADDEGRLRGSEALCPRARQNVVLELGYFLAKLGRGKIALLAHEDLEYPSNYLGVIRIPLRDGNDWRVPLAKALKRYLPMFNSKKALGL